MSEAVLNCSLSVIIIVILAGFMTSMFVEPSVNGVHYRLYHNNKTLSVDHPDYWVLYRVYVRISPVVDMMSDIARLIQCGHITRIQEVGFSNITPSAIIHVDFVEK